MTLANHWRLLTSTPSTAEEIDQAAASTLREPEALVDDVIATVGQLVVGVEGEKERAVRVIAARLRAQPGLFDMLEGSADLAASCQQRVVDAPGKQAWTLYYVSIGTRDRSGFRMNAGEVQREAGGWGNKDNGNYRALPGDQPRA